MHNKEYEVGFAGCNSVHYPKWITAYIVEPAKMNENTGIMHFAHGWGGNRYQYREMQKEFSDRYNLICISTEYRQSGFDFNPITGVGAYIPYDASNMQVIDCLNSVRKTLELYPDINKRRIISFGGSQGGHIAVLMSIFCPNTFALVISSSGLSYITPELAGWAGRDFSEDELAIRDIVKMASFIHPPVVLMHGTADAVLSEQHTRKFEEALRAEGKMVRVKYYEGGGHFLEPVSDRKSSILELADDLIKDAGNEQSIDFNERSKIVIPCVRKRFIIDWSKSMDDFSLVLWQEMMSGYQNGDRHG